MSEFPNIVDVAKKAGGVSKLAASLGITRGAIYQWKCVPLDRLEEVSALTNVPRHKLRPDVAAIFGPAPRKAAS